MNVILAFFVSVLPRRYWRGATGVGILFSGLVQLGFSMAGLISVYTRFSERVSDNIAEVTIAAATHDEGSDGRVHVGGAMAVSALTPIGFLGVSSSGRLLVYLVFSSLVRLLGFATDHPCGDPLLTIVDELIWDVYYSIKRRTMRLSQAAWSRWRDGREEPDGLDD